MKKILFILILCITTKYMVAQTLAEKQAHHTGKYRYTHFIDLIVDSAQYNFCKTDTTVKLIGYKIWDDEEYEKNHEVHTSFKNDTLIVVTTQADRVKGDWNIKFITDGKIDAEGALHINVVGYNYYEGMHKLLKGEVNSWNFDTREEAATIKKLNIVKKKLKCVVLHSYETHYEKTFQYINK